MTNASKSSRKRKPRALVPLRERFERHVFPVTESGCWIWMAGLDSGGYGSIRDGSMRKANRVAWELYRGPITDHEMVLHQCDIPCCVNPDHLFIGTQIDNMQDALTKHRNADTRGVKNGRAKLTEQQVTEIRALPGTLVNIAKLFGISKSMASYIRRGEHWKHI